MTDLPSQQPPSFLTQVLHRFVPIEPGEAGLMLRSFVIFFCVLCGYYLLRPVREEIGTAIGRDQLQWLFVAVFLAMLALVPAFGWLVKAASRKRVLPIIYGFFVLNLIAFWALFSASTERPGTLEASVFFVWASVYNLFIVSLFWSLTSELYSNTQAKRLYGFIAAGGSAGALTGPILAHSLVSYVSPNDLLLFAAAFLALALLAALDLRRKVKPNAAATSEDEEKTAGAGDILAGAKRVFQSPYLFLIAMYVLFANLIGTYFYLEQIRIVNSEIPDRVARIEFFASRDLAVSIGTILLQLFVTARVMKGLGVGITLAALPVSAAIGLAALTASPTLSVVAAVMVVERAIAFAFSNPAMKVLYTIVTPDEKYKAQNFVDTVVYRGGDAASGWIFNTGAKALGLSGGAIALLTMPAAALWIGTAYMLGRKHKARTAGHESPSASGTAAVR